MRLRRVEIAGFKSFAKKSTLTFTSPITSIVGPNGSGKSNVVEALKFVLGEQSIKSLRGKSGADLIFRGSNQTSKLSRAAVSVTFDNKDNIFAYHTGEGRVPITFEEITFTREVYADGTSKYLMNGTETRLKQTVELLASVNIGTSSHHIINQGEADRILRSSAKERREMVEDALGLKIFQFRIKESEVKLAKTTEHLKEVQLLRRELTPHLTFLKKQVEKAERARVLKEELEQAWKMYLGSEKKVLAEDRKRLEDALIFFQDKKAELEKQVTLLPQEQEVIQNGNDIKELESEAVAVRIKQNALERELGKLEGMIEAHRAILHAAPTRQGARIISFSSTELEQLLGDINHFLSQLKEADTFDQVQEISNRLLERVGMLREKLDADKPLEEKPLSRTSGPNTALTLRDLAHDLEVVQANMKKVAAERETIEKKLMAAQEHRESQLKNRELAGEKRFTLKSEIQQCESELQLLAVTKQQHIVRQTNFDTEIKEAGFLFGPQFLRTLGEELVPEENRIDLKRNIDRLKIKYEEHSGIGNEVLKEFEHTRDRDLFLQKEMHDIESSVTNLQRLIIDLKKTLDERFSTGVQSINKYFSEFFKTMFGGGSAFLSITIEKKKKSKSSEEDFDPEALEGGEEGQNDFFERGIEIHVSLPEKKVKELHMLSGGERSLVSIALLFAVSQVNPPPFLVLDETDAALDEANSRRYGDMLEKLAEFSQLIVVTHNRETMSRANVLYGITMGADGSSKLLSIKLDEAVRVAK